MSQTSSKISMPASRFKELRELFGRVFKHYQPSWWWMVLGAILLFSFNAFLEMNPDIAVMFGGNRSYLDLHVVETDSVVALKVENQRYGLSQNFEYIVLSPSFELQGSLDEKIYEQVKSNYQDIEIKIRVDGKTILTQNVYANFVGSQPNATSSGGHPLKIPVNLPDLGDHRVEVILTSIGGGETKEIDQYSVDVRRVNNPPSAPVILGASRSVEPDVIVINGFADPNAMIEIKEGDTIISGTLSDNLGHFVTPIKLQSLDSPITVYASNSSLFNSLFYPSNPPTSGLTTSDELIFNLRDGIVAKNLVVDTNYKISLGYQSLNQEFSFTLPANYPGVPEITSNKINLEKYLKILSGTILVNNQEIGYRFNDNQPIINLSDETAEINLNENGYSSSDFNYWGDSDFDFTFPDGFPLPGNTGQFQIFFSKDQRYSVETEPDLIEGNLYTWKKIAPGQTISVKLIRQDQRTSIRALSNLDFYEIAGDNGILRDVLRFGFQLLQAFSLLAGLWLIYSSKRLFYPSMLFIYARAILVLGIQILFISMFWELFSYSVLRYAYNWLAQNAFLYFSKEVGGFFQFYSSITFYPLTKAFVMLFFSVILMLIGKFLVSRKKYYIAGVLRTMASAVDYSVALLITAVILSFTHSVFFQDLSVNQFSIYTTMAVGGVTIYAIINRSFDAGDLLLNRFSIKKINWKLRLTKISLFAVALFLAYESGSVFWDITDVDFITNFTYRVQTIITRLGNFSLPFTFLFVLLAGIDLGRKAPWKLIGKTVDEYSGKVLQVKSWVGWSTYESNYLLFGQVLFAGYVVGTNDTWILLPISFLVAWLVYRYVLIESPYQISQITYLEKYIRLNRSNLLAQLAQDLAFLKLQKKKEEVLVNLANGKINPSEYEKTVLTLDSEMQSLKKPELDIPGVRVKDIVLAIGTFDKPIDNAVLGLRSAFLLQLPLLYIFIQYYLFKEIYSSSLHLWMILISQLISFVSRWLVMGFLFGLLYEFIRGNNGLRKSLFVSGAYALSILPYRLLIVNSISGASSYLFEIGQMSIFMICLGLLMDWETLKSQGYRFSYLKVVVSDIPSLVSVSSVLITTIGVVITSLLSGQLAQLLNGVATSILPNIVNLPLPPGP